MLCRVTAIDPDGRRSCADIEAESLYRAIFEYNAKAVTARALNLPIPQRNTEFEVEANGKVHRATFGQALDWASRKPR